MSKEEHFFDEIKKE